MVYKGFCQNPLGQLVGWVGGLGGGVKVLPKKKRVERLMPNMILLGRGGG